MTLTEEPRYLSAQIPTPRRPPQTVRPIRFRYPFGSAQKGHPLTDNPEKPAEAGPTPPSRLLALSEGRALLELGWFFQNLPLLGTAPKGNGHPVLVLPGFLASDLSTALMRRYLKSRGYRVHAWKLGRNLGLRPGVETRLVRRLRSTYWQSGERVSIVGWSLGGIYARELARRHPEMVRQVITLGSPFNLSSEANHAFALYKMLQRPTDIAVHEEMFRRLRDPLPVPATAVYSRTDGVVAWECCLDTASAIAENVEVFGSHCGLGHNPMALWVVADRLAQSQENWQPFERRGVLSLLYREAPASAEEALEAPHESTLGWLRDRLEATRVALAS